MHTEHSAPDAFGPFRVLHQIGAGTLGPVYRGHDTERERLVAVKLFKLDLPPDVTHQFVAGLERIVNANLSHPGLAAPIGAGMTNNSAYVAMDYVAAEPVDLTLRELGPLAPADVLQLAARVASALDLAVAAGFTHGCLHPRDVLMSSRDTRITGIGIGQLLAKLGVAVPVRRPYTAPERINGQSWDRRSDVFSLAALVHELLWNKRVSGTGAQAVEGMTALPGGDLDALKRVFKRALADDPGERHPTPKIFVDALKRALPDVPADLTIALPPAVAAAPTPPPARNLRLATPSRPAKVEPDLEPLLPLATPDLEVEPTQPLRFADLEIEPAPVGAAPTGPSILEDSPEIALPPAFAEAVDRPISLPKPEQPPASDPLALSWLMRDLEPLKTPEPADMPDLPIVVDEIQPDEQPKPEEPATGPAPIPDVPLRIEPAAAVVAPPPKSPEKPMAPASRGRRELREHREHREHREEPVESREPAEPRETLEPAEPSELRELRESLSARSPRLPREPVAPRDTPKPSTPPEQPEVPREIPVELTMLERSQSAVWPLLLALVLGGAAGFAGGYFVGVREHPAAVASATPAPGREFTEGTVPVPPKTETKTEPKTELAGDDVRRDARGTAPPVPPAAPSTPPVAAAPPKVETPPAKPAWTGGRVTVRSSPAGATVSVDDHEVGRTPTVIRDLTEGPHVIHVARDGYTAHDRRIVLTRDRPAQLVNATLPRQPQARAAAAPPTRPAAQPAGRTAAPQPARTPASQPARINTPPFSRTAPPASIRPPEPDEPVPARRGALTVESRPTGARVFLDGKLVGTTPLTWAGIPAGDHAIRLEHDGYTSWTGTVRIVGSETARVTGSLER